MIHSRVGKLTLARAAFHAAYRCRVGEKKPPHEAINVIDFAIKQGISVRYVDLPSIEGMFVREPPSIYISSLRPPVRQNFTCAHELGHYFFNHGSQIEELVHNPTGNSGRDPNEYMANLFAGFLLMPQAALAWICKARGQDLRSSFFTPPNVYSVANRLGVGYTTLTNQLFYGLNLIQRDQFKLLARQNLKSVRKLIAGEHVAGHLIDVHDDWIDTPIDARVGDHILFRFPITFDANNIERLKQTSSGSICLVRRPGIVTVKDSRASWSNQIRVSRSSYAGLAEYRHLEDPEYE